MGSGSLCCKLWPRSYWVSSASTVGKLNRKIKKKNYFGFIPDSWNWVGRLSSKFLEPHPCPSTALTPTLMPFLVPDLPSPTRRKASAKLQSYQPPCWRHQGKMYLHRRDGEASAKDGGGMSAGFLCLSVCPGTGSPALAVPALGKRS